MRGFITLMIILIFIPVIFSVYILYKRLHEAPKDNKAREILLQAMCMEELKKKKNSDLHQDTMDIPDKKTNDQKENNEHEQNARINKNDYLEIDDDIKRSMQIAKETLFSEDAQKADDEKEKDAKRKEAADMVLNMMVQKGKSGASKEELQEMIKVLSDKNK